MLRVYTFKAEPELIEELDFVALELGLPNRSEAIRTAIKEFIDRNKTRRKRVKVVKLYR